MTRMTKEMSLVLLGSGILTAGYFLVPQTEEAMEAKAEEQAAKRTGHGSNYHRSGGFFLFIHSHGYAGTTTGRPAAYSTSTRAGGFGGFSKSFSGGGS
jgi:hypothetical protein